MVIRSGRVISELEVGAKAEIPPGEVHGLLNIGAGQLIGESEVIFPHGYSPDHDLLVFGAGGRRVITTALRLTH